MSLLCIATHLPAHIPPSRTANIFLLCRSLLSKTILKGTFWEHEFDSLPHISGCMDRPEINFKTAVAEGKKRGHVCSKTPASRAVRMLLNFVKPCFASLYRSVQMFKIYIKP